MGRNITFALSALCWAGGTLAAVPAAAAQTPIDGRIVRVVYQVVPEGSGSRDATWGFHLTHMQDGRYCVRLGNPGRLSLAVIAKVADICFDAIPGRVERSHEQASQGYWEGTGRRITLISFHKGSIALSEGRVVLEIITCSRVEDAKQPEDLGCGRRPVRYFIDMKGQGCSAEAVLSRARAGTTTCEHYPAR